MSDNSTSAYTTASPPDVSPVKIDPGGFLSLDIPVIVAVLMLWREMVSLRIQLREQISDLHKVVAKLEEVVERFLSNRDPRP